MRNFDANTTEKNLTVKKENRLALIHNVTYTTIRISKKAIFSAFALSMLNMFV